VRKNTGRWKEKRTERKEKKKRTKTKRKGIENGKFFETWKFPERKIKDNL
jgi:hypothetical protein